MKYRNPWPGAIGRIAGALAALVVIGYLLGHMAAVVLAGALVYSGWQIRNLILLDKWLRQPSPNSVPRGNGLWGAIFDNLYRIQRRHRLRRRRLANLLQRFKESSNAMPDAVVVLQGTGEMQWWNEAARHLLGLRWPSDEGQRIDHLLRHPDFDAFWRDDRGREAVTVPSPVHPEMQLEVRLVPYGAGQRLLIARDITRILRLERTRRDFVANVSHELRTPLTVIRGVAEMAGDYPDISSEEQTRANHLILEQSERMQRLVEDLLLLSRLESEGKDVAPEWVALPALIEQIVREARTLGEHVINLHVPPGACLLGNAAELRSAFSNLVFNAVKYTPSPGKIQVSWYEDGDFGCFRVKDNGPGIPSEHLPRLTERFYRVDSGRSARTGGSGLGLAIVKHVLQRHDAELDIHSKRGEGSEFICRFPVRRVRG